MLSCELLGVSKAAYYRWLSGNKCSRELENEKIAQIMEQIHTENPDKGYRRIKDDLTHDYTLHVNEKWVLRICRERYCGKRVAGKEELLHMIHSYIAYYSNRRVQRNHAVFTSHGKLPDAFVNTYKRIASEYFPQNEKYRYDSSEEREGYPSDNTDDPHSICEIWIAVNEKNALHSTLPPGCGNRGEVLWRLPLANDHSLW